MKYAPVTEEILAQLSEIVGESHVLTRDIERYAFDESNKAGHDETPPEAVVKPASAAEVAEIMKLANRARIPVTPRGAGSGLSGGAVPVYGGIVMDLERMNRLIEVDEQNLTATAEAGIITNEINLLVRDRGLFFAGYPMSLETCTLGGNIAENAGGGKAIKYGVTRTYVLGLEVVTPLGEIVEMGGKLDKDVTGYDLKHLLIGSEGTLGVITKAILWLIPMPKAKSTVLAMMPTAQAAIDCVPKLRRMEALPSSIEFMDRFSYDSAARYVGETMPAGDAGAVMLVEFDGASREETEGYAERAGDLMTEAGALKVYMALSRADQERVWKVRRSIADSFLVYYPVNCIEDIVVPTASIPEIIPPLEEIARDYGIVVSNCGHAGDGNLHTTFFKPPEMDMETWHTRLDQALRALYREAQKLGGKITGEHGIGLKRRPYFLEITPKAELDLMRALKRAWDPNGILNPGKVI